MSSSDASKEGVSREFIGYRRADGRLGVRNRILVLPSVICSHLVAEEIAGRVDRAVATPHDHGCAQLGEDSDQTAMTFEGIGANPNIAGTVVVGLGCEEVQSDAVAAAFEERGLPVREVSIQDAGGTEPCIEAGVEAAKDLATHADEVKDVCASLGDLMVGVVVDDIDDSTVERANPLVAELITRITDVGGRVVVAGAERFTIHPDVLMNRATTKASERLTALVERHEGLPPRATRVGRAAASRGPEDALGFLGDLPIRDVIRYGELATHESGIALVDAPSRFEEAATGLAASGAHIVVHVTNDGVTTGHPVVPVLKVSGNSDTVETLPNDIDVDATSATPADLERALVTAAGGSKTAAEQHGLTEFAITRVGPSM